ncbi:MAG: hypothetical protein IPM39_14770 [Chloroflexi bacterium]|nr:hypothetical protein [Chloroflexota bacterium]
MSDYDRCKVILSSPHMNKTPFLWLGANRARKWPVGDKVRLLDHAAQASLPVPPGAVLLDELFGLLLDAGVIAVQNGLVTAVDADWLHETFYESARFPRLDTPMIMRAAFSLDGADQPGDPLYAPQRAIHLTDPAQLAAGLQRVWSLAGAPTHLRRDVLVMKMVAAEMLGTAVTALHSQDHITYHPPDAAPESLDLAQLGRFARPDPGLPPFAQRLQMLLRGARRSFPTATWQIDWLDDGRVCWLIQVHPCPR